MDSNSDNNNDSDSNKFCDYIKRRTEFEEKYIKDNELNEKYTRLYAEFENYKKRQLVKSDILTEGIKSDIFRGFIDVIDDIERFKLNEDVPYPMSLIFDKIEDFIWSNGITKYGKSNNKFDCDLHECIQLISDDSGSYESGDIIKVVSNGYQLDGKVIKYAKVIVCK